jgi:hypothetical protein
MTPTLVALVIGLVVGGALAWLARGDTIARLERQVEWHREQEIVATDRLLHAWREDKIVVPARPVEATPPPQPLPAALQEEVDQWENPETRAAIDEKIRGMLRRGWAPTRILLELDNHHPVPARS